MTSTPATVVASPRLALLDLLRFFAALSVLAFHWLYSGIANGKVQTIEHSWAATPAQYGYLGVNLFFLISGFVIATSVRGKSPAKFAVGRLVRLYPAYWAAMLTTGVIAVFFGSTVMTVTAPQVLANFTMVSRIFGQSYIDGVYWTLFLELAFYVMVFILIMFGLRDRLDTFFPIWSVVIAVVSLIFPSLTNEMLIGGLFSFFAGGAIISTAHRRGWTWFRLAGLVAAICTSVRYVIRDAAVSNPELSPLVLAVLVVAMYGIILMQTIPAVGSWRIPGSQTLGGCTYPLYLLHAHIGYMVFANFANEVNKWFVYAITLIGVFGASYLLRELAEVRTKTFWYRFFNLVVGKPMGTVSRVLSTVHPRLGGGPSEESESRVPAENRAR